MIGLNRVIVGDARRELAKLPTSFVDCVITSPPYFQLRDFGVSGQLGLEATVETWVDELRLALNGLIRVLKPSGSLWLNLGDTYSRHARFGAPPKSLLLAPERLLLALSKDGWIVRNKVIWAKTNPMPSAVADRLSTTYDFLYFLTRSPRYFFDLDAIRLPHRSLAHSRRGRPYPPAGTAAPRFGRVSGNHGLPAQRARGKVGHRLGKNPGDVWPIGTGSFHGAHFAVFPPGLVERPLLATCPERLCTRCGAPHRRSSRARHEGVGPNGPPPREPRVFRLDRRYTVSRRRGPLRPGCACGASSRPGLVLDPFFGAGTVGLVAERHRRHWLGIEINPGYARLAEQRVARASEQESPYEGMRLWREQPRESARRQLALRG
ncbi:MAG TPA: site-specific DNA-methyltransferase [Gaiellaceae bacterium]